MATPSGRTFFGLIPILLLSTFASAQDVEFQNAVRLLRLGQKEEALAQLRQVLAADLSSADALRLYRNTDQDIWYDLVLEEGDIGKIAQSLLDRARVEVRELSRDQDLIAQLVDQACSSASFEDRSRALRALVADHGEFAVPGLVRRLADADDDTGQIHAIVALYRLGLAATMPLIEALKSDNGNLRHNVAAALSQVGDPRAAAALARLVQVDDQESVRDISRRTLDKLGVQGMSPVDLFLANARGYLTGRGVGSRQMSEVLWSLSDGQLTYADVPAQVYGLELGKKNAHEAVNLDPLSDEARTVLAQIYLAEAAVISASLAADPENPDLQALSAKLPGLRMVALATGPATLRRALEDAMASDLSPVAVEAIDALAVVEDEASPATAMSLQQALQSSDIRISYAAALALAPAGDAIPAAQQGEVVEALGRAVTEESMKLITVIDATPATTQVAAEASGRGSSYQVVDSAVKAIGDLNTFPNVDVVVVNEILDRLPEDVISLIRKDQRMAGVKILVVANDVGAAEDRFGDSVDGVIQGPLSAQTLRAEVDSALDGVDLSHLRRRADEVAVAAADALMLLAGTNVSVGAALDSLAAQLNRGDDVAVPAAGAIGDGGNLNQLPALLGGINNGDTSLELKVACAVATGKILGRASDVPADAFEALIGVLESDAPAALHMAVAIALGKSPLVPGNSLRLVELLRTVGTIDGDL